MDGSWVNAMLYQEKYRGLSIQINRNAGGEYPKTIIPIFPTSQLDYDRKNKGVFFINEEFACAQSSSPTLVYDFGRQQVLYTPSH